MVLALGPRASATSSRKRSSDSAPVYFVIDDKSRCAVNAERAGECLGAVNGLRNGSVGGARFDGLDIGADFFERALQQGRVKTAPAAHQFGVKGQKFKLFVKR